MVSLILVIISIALMATMLTATISYLPADAVYRQSIQKETDYGIRLLEMGATRYMDGNRGSDGSIIYPGTGVDLKPLIYPQYGFIPQDVKQSITFSVITASYGGAPAVAICAYPKDTPTDSTRRIMANLRSAMPQNSAYVANSCGATADVANGAYLTYWLVISHIN